MPRRNINAGTGSDHGGGIKHNRNGQSGGDYRSMESQLHEQWMAFRAQANSRERRAARRSIEFQTR